MAQKNRQLAVKAQRAAVQRAAFVVSQNMAEVCRPAHHEHAIITASHVGMRGTVKVVTYKMATPGPIISAHW
jgi:hypothetical protein